MVGSYWMGGSRREGEGKGSGWQGKGGGGEICTYTHLSLAVQQCSELAQCDDRGNTRHST